MYLSNSAVCAGPCRTLRIRVCSRTPRFSYEVLKTRVPVHVLGMTVVRGAWVYGLGRVYGWVVRVGIPGEYYPATCPREEP